MTSTTRAEIRAQVGEELWNYYINYIRKATLKLRFKNHEVQDSPINGGMGNLEHNIKVYKLLRKQLSKEGVEIVLRHGYALAEIEIVEGGR